MKIYILDINSIFVPKKDPCDLKPKTKKRASGTKKLPFTFEELLLRAILLLLYLYVTNLYCSWEKVFWAIGDFVFVECNWPLLGKKIKLEDLVAKNFNQNINKYDCLTKTFLSL